MTAGVGFFERFSRAYCASYNQSLVNFHWPKGGQMHFQCFPACLPNSSCFVAAVVIAQNVF